MNVEEEVGGRRLFTIKFSHKGAIATVENIDARTITAHALLEIARSSLDSIIHSDQDDVVLRLIYKGKTIAREGNDGTIMAAAASTMNNDNVMMMDNRPAFSPDMTLPKDNILKIIVMSAPVSEIRKLNSSRSDPTIRGFDDERKSVKALSKDTTSVSTYWGPLHTTQHKKYKFCRFQECTDASFGTRPGSSTPHAFEARRLLERLATDPGIVTILTSRELVVGTLGEMDPIDDRIAQRMEHEGGRVLGYNTNYGMRIDIKLRTDDLSTFRPYKELASTIIHELSHNWVGDHTVLFWTNYGQMRVEYLWKHARLMQSGVFVSGKRTATLAEVTDMIQEVSTAVRINRGEGGNNDDSSTKARMMNHICRSVIDELVTEMTQHRIPVQLVAPSIITFGEELMNETKDEDVMEDMGGGHRLGGGDTINTTSTSVGDAQSESDTVEPSARERALAAAERRALEAKNKKKENDKYKEKIED
jgi:hypothetical protein